MWPTYFKSAKGAEVVDLDGKTYLDMSYCGNATILGFADPDVNAAVKSAIDMGSMSTLNCAADIELAELLIELHP
jgi:glutamate-1-semialdehyde 2,1-aminomutase